MINVHYCEHRNLHAMIELCWPCYKQIMSEREMLLEALKLIKNQPPEALVYEAVEIATNILKTVKP